MSVITDKDTINVELLKENTRLLTRVEFLLKEIDKLNKQIEILFSIIGEKNGQ